MVWAIIIPGDYLSTVGPQSLRVSTELGGGQYKGNLTCTEAQEKGLELLTLLLAEVIDLKAKMGAMAESMGLEEVHG